MNALNKQQVIDVLNRILEQELAGVVRYTHYSILVFDYSRIPIVVWLRQQPINRSSMRYVKVGPCCCSAGEVDFTMA